MFTRVDRLVFCRHAAWIGGAVLAAWSVCLAVAVAVGWHAGLVPSTDLLGSWAMVVLPTAILLGAPLGAAAAWWRLVEAGEWRAALGTGRSPFRLVLVGMLPALPLVVAMHWLVHQRAPSALRAFRDGVVSEAAQAPRLWLDAWDRVGASVRVPGTTRRHGLLPIGDDAALALVFEGEPSVRNRRLDTGPGSVQVVAIGDPAATIRLRFDDARLGLPVGRRGLANLTEQELSSKRLESGARRWLRARRMGVGGQKGMDGERVVHGELARRHAMPLALFLAVALASGIVSGIGSGLSTGGARRLRVMVLCSLPLCVAQFGPRLVEALWR